MSFFASLKKIYDWSFSINCANGKIGYCYLNKNAYNMTDSLFSEFRS